MYIRIGFYGREGDCGALRSSQSEARSPSRRETARHQRIHQNHRATRDVQTFAPRQPGRKKAALPNAAFTPNRLSSYIKKYAAQRLTAATHHDATQGEQATEQGIAAGLWNGTQSITRKNLLVYIAHSFNQDSLFSACIGRKDSDDAW